MPLSWNEIRARATSFSKDWKDAQYENGESQSFYNDFFKVFGRRRRDVAVYEEKVKKLNDQTGFIDLFWPGHLIVEQKSAGRSLKNAREQATDYFLAIKEEEKPRYILLSDFQTFELLDLEEDKEYHFKLSDLPEEVKLFGFIAGYQQQKYRDQDPVNIKASELMSDLHKQLEESGYVGESLERLLVRIMFCLFADDTGIFQPDMLLRFIEDHTKEDGSDLGSHLVHLFEILDTAPEKRQSTLDEDLAVFPYVNGELFSNTIRTPSFNGVMRAALIKCCYFNWSKVSPALFGSLFQTVMLPEEQRQGGAHYTSERNILKVIEPLFLNDLRGEFEKIKSDKSTQRKKKLERFHEKLADLAFFDPACGCGNFLILSYRELRLLEVEILEELYPAKKTSKVLNIDHLSKIDVDQFYGIEIEEFPVRIAEAAMWLVDHQMNMKLSEAFGQAFVRLPLQKSAEVVHGNALTTDWSKILPPKKCSFILGNPPFIGKKEQTKAQKDELNSVFSGVRGKGVLDYVSCWYLKAAKYIQGQKIEVGFVSTKSIVQGEQVGVLWSELYKYNCKINFGHRTFKWTLDEKKAKGMKIAAVHVVIVGFSLNIKPQKYLFEYDHVLADPHKVHASNINPYLVDGPNVVVLSRRSPICSAPEINYGSIAIDDGHLILNETERNELIKNEPEIAGLIRPFMGADEYIKGKKRYCFWLKDVPPERFRNSKTIMARVTMVREFRLKSERKETKELAKTPFLFGEIRQPNDRYLIIPKVSSESRSYIPIGYSSSENIANGSSLIVPQASLYSFGIVISELHMAWMRYVGGRTKSDYQYSSSLVYNNFPWPNPTEKQRQQIEKKSQEILNTRNAYSSSTLADLYDSKSMPPDLLTAHQALDRAVEKTYRSAPFKGDKSRMEFLFGLYKQLQEPLIANIKTNTKQRRKK